MLSREWMKSIALSAGLRIDQSVGKDAARKTYDCNNTDQGLANFFFYKVHVFGFVDYIVIFCNYSSLPWECKSSHRQYANKWV